MAGPTEGRVRVISPYRARARRVAHMFVCSLQDGDFPRRDTGGPLLSDERRAGAGPAASGRRPRSRTATCSRSAYRGLRSGSGSPGAAPTTRAGRPRAPRSSTRRASCSHPILPQGTEERDEAIVAEAGGRGLAESVFDREAPSEDELARARRAAPRAQPPSIGGSRWPESGRLRAARARSAWSRSSSGCGEMALRALDARGVRRVSLPVVRRPRAEAAADRPGGGAPDAGLDRPPGARGLYAEPPAPEGRPTPGHPGRLVTAPGN